MPAGRHLRANFASSADGAVAVAGTSRGLSSDADRELFHILRSMAEVVLVGAGTVRAENYGGARPGDDGRIPPLAVVSRTAALAVDARVFTETRVRPIVVTCERASTERVAMLREVADVVVAGSDDVDLRAALDELASRGLQSVLCEGGPHLFGSLLDAGLVDELCLTVAPLLAGGPAGRIVAGLGTSPAASLRLNQVLEDEGFLFLRYSTVRP